MDRSYTEIMNVRSNLWVERAVCESGVLMCDAQAPFSVCGSCCNQVDPPKFVSHFFLKEMSSEYLEKFGRHFVPELLDRDELWVNFSSSKVLTKNF